MQDIKKQYHNEHFTGERALFGEVHAGVYDSIFDDGESPLKESRDIEVVSSTFGWKYPLWYAKDILVTNTTWTAGARAGVWYTKNIEVSHSVIAAPKNFRRCDNLRLHDVTFTNAEETMWQCKNVTMDNVQIRGDYFAMNCTDMEVDHMVLDGNYGFDGAKNVTVRNSKLLTKDAFWNSENVTVENSYIAGEYLGWNAKNLTLINCTIDSLQGLCYIENLKMVHCSLLNTTLAFEYSTVDAQITGSIKSVINPGGGRIVCDSIGELIMEEDKVDVNQTRIIYRNEEAVDETKICLCKCLDLREAG